MSYPIMPALPLSLAKGLHKAPMFSSVVQKTAAQRGNSSFSLTPYGTWNFEFDLDSIQGNEASSTSVLAQFFGIHMACNGRTGPFLFTDPQDNAVAYANSGMLNVTPGVASPMGSTGDGTSTQFQLARSIAGLAWDIIQNLNGSIVVKVNGSPVVPSSVSSSGVVTFSSAPANNAVLTWTGSYYYLVRFDEDTVDSLRSYTTNNGTDQWQINNVKFSSEFV